MSYAIRCLSLNNCESERACYATSDEWRVCVCVLRLRAEKRVWRDRTPKCDWSLVGRERLLYDTTGTAHAAYNNNEYITAGGVFVFVCVRCACVCVGIVIWPLCARIIPSHTHTTYAIRSCARTPKCRALSFRSWWLSKLDTAAHRDDDDDTRRLQPMCASSICAYINVNVVPGRMVGAFWSRLCT